jgi:pimeloyl-ACP methyl ester carboxylesterase
MGRLLRAQIGLMAAVPALLWAYGWWLERTNERLGLSELRDPEQTVAVNGLSLHYLDVGQGPPVLLLHGMGGSLANFPRTIELLSRSRRVVALDLAGFGLSDRPRDADLTPQGQARLVRGLMQALGIEQADVIGHSLGGAIALHLAARYPESVRRLVLVSSAVPGRLIPWFLRPFWFPPVVRTIVALCLHCGPAREWMWRAGVWSADVLTPELRRAMRLPSLVRGTTDAITRVGLALAREEPLDLSQVRQPVLLLWGAEDRWVDLKSARRLLRTLPDARLEVVPRARHMVLEERPDEAHAAILSFLQQGPLPGQATGEAAGQAVS